MHLSLQKILASSGLLTSVQQSYLAPSCHSEVDAILKPDEPHFGYQGPGVYHLVSVVDRFQLSLGSEGSSDGVPAVVWTANETQSQLWFVDDVGDGRVSIASNVTGELLTATTSRGKVPTLNVSSENPGTHWEFAEYTYKGNPYNATRLRSVAFPNEVLFTYRHIPYTNGDPVHIWPLEGSYKAAAWLFHYMGPS